MGMNNRSTFGQKKKNKSLSWILLALLLLMGISACTPSSGPFNDYYVSPLGVDETRRGRSPAEPWQTIGFALDHADYTRGTPRINLAAGIFRENLAIKQPVIIIGVGVGDPLYDTGISVIEPAIRPSAPIEPYHTVSGGVRVEFYDLVFHFGRVQVTGGSLFVENVTRCQTT